MPRPYSEDLRLRVVHAVESGKNHSRSRRDLSSQSWCLKRPSVMVTDQPRSPY
jgi:hypothetical protein